MPVYWHSCLANAVEHRGLRVGGRIRCQGQRRGRNPHDPRIRHSLPAATIPLSSDPKTHCLGLPLAGSRQVARSSLTFAVRQFDPRSRARCHWAEPMGSVVEVLIQLAGHRVEILHPFADVAGHIVNAKRLGGKLPTGAVRENCLHNLHHCSAKITPIWSHSCRNAAAAAAVSHG